MPYIFPRNAQIVTCKSRVRLIIRPTGCLVVSALVTRQWVLGLNPKSGMSVCSGSDTILNASTGLFSSRVQKMTIALVIKKMTYPAWGPG